MSAEHLVPFALGVVAVLQATMNKEISTQVGLAAATALNMAGAAVCAFAFAAVCALRGETNGIARWTWDPAAFRAFWCLPGAIGFVIVLGLPWAVQRIGALSTFVALVAAQVVTSAAWDRVAEGVPLSPARIAGALCAIAAVVLTSRAAPA